MNKYGFIKDCFFCHASWGSCHCKDVGEDEGFEFEGTNIVQPTLDCTGRFFVNPEVFYGEAYIKWRKQRWLS